MAEREFATHQRIGFMSGDMKVPADFDSIGREHIEMAFAGSKPRESASVCDQESVRSQGVVPMKERAERPTNWDGFLEALEQCDEALPEGFPRDGAAPAADRSEGGPISGG